MMKIYGRDTGIWFPEDDLPPEPGQLAAALPGCRWRGKPVNQGSTFYFALPVDEAALRGKQLNPEFTAS
jgi:hypothetical protein